MELAFPWPYTQGEWLAFSAAGVTALFGLFTLFAPRMALRVLRLQTRPDHPEAIAQSRATVSGFHLGLGLCALLLAQPLIYLTLGVSWALTAFGRIVSMLSDRGNTAYNWIALIIEMALAALPLSFALGLIG